MAYNFKVVKDYGTLSKHGDLELKLRLMSWGGNAPRYDLRTWKGNVPLKGMSFSKDDMDGFRAVLATLDLGRTICHPKDETPALAPSTKPSRVVNALATLPANDANYNSFLGEATEDEVKEAIDLMKSKGGRNKMRLKKCEDKLAEFHGARILAELRKKKKTAPAKIKTNTTKADAPKEKKTKVVQFPKKKEEIEKLPETDEKRTYEECEAKLSKEREMFRDSDSQYVIDGLLEVCQTDQNFRNNVMREDKSYAGAFEYFFNMAKSGHALRYGNICYLDNNLALEYAIDYFNKAEKG